MDSEEVWRNEKEIWINTRVFHIDTKSSSLLDGEVSERFA